MAGSIGARTNWYPTDLDIIGLSEEGGFLTSLYAILFCLLVQSAQDALAVPQKGRTDRRGPGDGVCINSTGGTTTS